MTDQFDFATEYAPALESTDHIQIEDQYSLFINGEFVKPESSKYFSTHNPDTGEKLSEVAEADSADIDKAVSIFQNADCSFELMHCISTYPMEDEDANLNCVQTLRDRYRCNVGYSGHEVGLITTCAAAAIGASSVERHITLDRAMYGSDQAASVEIGGFHRLVEYIRVIESALGDGIKRVSDEELAIKKQLRHIEDL